MLLVHNQSRATHILFFLIWHRLVIFHLKGDITFVLIVHKGGESRVRHTVVNSNRTLLLFVSGGIWGWRCVVGDGMCRFLTVAPDNSIRRSFAVTGLLDLSVPLSPKGYWIHLVSQQQLSDTEVLFPIESDVFLNAVRWCLWSQPYWSAVLETLPDCRPLFALAPHFCYITENVYMQNVFFNMATANLVKNMTY